jgi:large subunit ribosomal protein L35
VICAKNRAAYHLAVFKKVKEKKMPKLKTKSSVKKRFRLTANKQVKMGQAGKRHGMRKRSQKMIRDARGMTIMHPSDAKNVKRFYLHV